MNSVWTLGDWLQYLFSFIFVIGLLLTLLCTLRKLQNGSSLLRKSTPVSYTHLRAHET